MSKRTLLMVVSIVASLALAATGTLAYLSDSDMDTNVMVLGNVDIVQNEQERTEDGELDQFTQNQPAYPAVGPVEWADEGVEIGGTEYPVYTDELANVIDKFVTVTNTGKSDAYIRTIIAIEAPDFDPNDLIHVNVNEDIDYTDWAPVEIDGVEYIYSVFTYPEALAAGETSAPSLMQLFLDSATTNEDVALFGDTWEVLALSQAVQTNGFDDAATALDAAFGEVNAENIAEWVATTTTGTPGDEWPNNNPPEVAETVDELVEFLSNPQKDAAILMSPIDYGTVHVTSSMENVTILGTDGANVKFNFDSTAQVDGMTIQDLNLTHQESSAAFVDGGIFNIDAGASVQGLELKNITASISGGRSSFVGLQEQTADVTITECDITGGKYLVYGSNPIEKLTITDNNLTGISSWVVMLNSADFVGMELTITGNTMDHCTGGVAKTLGSSQPDGAATVFTDNTLTASTGHDGAASKWFTIPGAADTITVSGNTLDGAAFTPGTANGLGK